MATNPYKLIFLLTLLFASCAKENNDPAPQPDPEPDFRVHTVWDMDKEEPVINSHKGDEMNSSFQPIYSKYKLLDNLWCLNGIDPEKYPDQRFANYPRIKVLANGEFIMFYHGGRYGSRIWYTKSTDFRNWSTPVMLFAPKKVKIDGKDDTRRYVNPDAVILKDGTILLVTSYRAVNHYSEGKGGGLSFRRSTDNGITWSEEMEVSKVGSNWEPYLMLLDDGTIHCYYTDAIPQTRNSGTALIISKDGGYTWSDPIRVCQQYKYDYYSKLEGKKEYNGQKIYTDQMPCFRVLNDGKTIVGWLEARLENPVPSDCGDSDTYKSFCDMSLVRNPSLTWEDLTSYNVRKDGPADRESNVVQGASGYVVTFPSGEVVLTFNIKSLFRLKIGDCEARKWRGDKWTDDYVTPFDTLGYWGSAERVGQNMMAIAIHGMDKTTEDDATVYYGLQTGMVYLNHRLDCSPAAIKLDGNAAEWKTTRAFYLSTRNGADAIIRTCRDEQNIYFAVECQDDTQDNGTTVELILNNQGTSNYYNIKATRKGMTTTISGARAVAQTGKSTSDRNGFCCEMMIPLSSLKTEAGGTLMCYGDISAGGEKVAFTLAKDSNANTWQKIVLK